MFFLIVGPGAGIQAVVVSAALFVALRFPVIAAVAILLPVLATPARGLLLDHVDLYAAVSSATLFGRV